MSVAERSSLVSKAAARTPSHGTRSRSQPRRPSSAVAPGSSVACPSSFAASAASRRLSAVVSPCMCVGPPTTRRSRCSGACPASWTARTGEPPRPSAIASATARVLPYIDLYAAPSRQIISGRSNGTRGASPRRRRSIALACALSKATGHRRRGLSAFYGAAPGPFTDGRALGPAYGHARARMQTVIVGIEGSERAADALALARQLAEPSARWILLRAYPADPTISGDGGTAYARALLADAEATLAPLREGPWMQTVAVADRTRHALWRAWRRRAVPRWWSSEQATQAGCAGSSPAAPANACCQDRPAPSPSRRVGTPIAPGQSRW